MAAPFITIALVFYFYIYKDLKIVYDSVLKPIYNDIKSVIDFFKNLTEDVFNTLMKFFKSIKADIISLGDIGIKLFKDLEKLI